MTFSWWRGKPQAAFPPSNTCWSPTSHECNKTLAEGTKCMADVLAPRPTPPLFCPQMCQLTDCGSRAARVLRSSCLPPTAAVTNDNRGAPTAEPSRCSLGGHLITVRWRKIFTWKAHFKLRVDDMLSYTLTTETAGLVWRGENTELAHSEKRQQEAMDLP